MLLNTCKICLRNQLFKIGYLNKIASKQCFTIYSCFYNDFKYDVSSPEQAKVANIIQKYEDKILYSGYVEAKSLKLGFVRNFVTMDKKQKREKKQIIERQRIEPIPVSLKYLYDIENIENNRNENSAEIHTITHFPFDQAVEKKDFSSSSTDLEKENDESPEYKNLADIEIKERLQHLNASNWMADYENYPEEDIESDNWKINYGTPDPKSSISNVPCGGCGALLHCKDTAIPGYIPSEIYKNYNKKGGTPLEAIICQRCYFLKHFNLALQVQVSPEEYPQVLRTIRDRKRALVILIVDLLDFPCSIWPGAANLLGSERSIFLVGNKVDLLPQDNKGFLGRVTKNLYNAARESGFATTDIKHVALISATTGYGIEDLITTLFNYWQYNGDVFLVGCTNVGKSSLFNALLQSDYCKSQASDLIQRATVSPWPGTTLNLLKFPILRPSGFRNVLRMQRLKQHKKQVSEENELRNDQLLETKNPKYANLIGHIGRTFVKTESVKQEDLFSLKGSRMSLEAAQKSINENNKVYAMSKWCYDTPGVVQPAQLLHLLTAEELTLALPKRLIRPQTFCLHPGTSIFIGGLSRLDFLEGDSFARFTVFCSSSLPITICRGDAADELYEELLGTEYFAVPTKSPDRLKFWPGLKTSKSFTVKGTAAELCCADVVLSSSGWISIAGVSNVEYKIRASVPENCGIFLRDALLPYIVGLRGMRVRSSPAYKSNKFYIKR